MENYNEWQCVIYDQEMTKQKYANDKKLQAKITKRKKEITDELDNKVIEVSNLGFGFGDNISSLFLTKDGYVYKEGSGEEYCDIELIGYMDLNSIDKFMSYLLVDENILERKKISLSEMGKFFDYDVLILFWFNNEYYIVPDDVFCKNNEISKYNNQGCFSSRIREKLNQLAKKTINLDDYKKRKELTKELEQIDTFIERYGEQKDSGISEFFKIKQE